MKKKYFLLFIGIILFNFSGYAQQASALNFDGVNDEVVCGDDASVQITGTSITLEARVNIDVFADFFWQGTIVTKDESAGGSGGYGLRLGAAGELSFFLGEGVNWPEVISPANSLTTGTWYHIAGTYDGTTMRLYVDGLEVATTALTVPIAASTSPLRIGSSNFDGRLVDGTIDEVRVWNTVRTPAELMDNMNNELTLPQTGLAAYYKFNQGIAGADNSAETMLTDELGTNNGTLNNFALTGTESNWVDGGLLTTPDCPTPENLATASITSESVDLTWDAVSEAVDGYDYFVFADGADPFNDAPLFEDTVSTNAATVNGLTADTSYDVYVASVCDDMNEIASDFSEKLDFTTAQLGIDDVNSTNFTFSPNPTSGSLLITSSKLTEYTLDIYNVLGQNVLSATSNTQRFELDVTSLQTDVYFVKITADNGAISTQKLIKK